MSNNTSQISKSNFEISKLNVKISNFKISNFEMSNFEVSNLKMLDSKGSVKKIGELSIKLLTHPPFISGKKKNEK